MCIHRVGYPLGLRVKFLNLEAFVRKEKWAMGLLEYHIDFESRNVIKSQVLVDVKVD